MSLRPKHALLAFVPAAIEAAIPLAYSYATSLLGTDIGTVRLLSFLQSSASAGALVVAAGLGAVVARDAGVDAGRSTLTVFALFAVPVLVADAVVVGVLGPFTVDRLNVVGGGSRIAIRAVDTAIPLGFAGVAGAAVARLRA